jgi:hypothetical protein
MLYITSTCRSIWHLEDHLLVQVPQTSRGEIMQLQIYAPCQALSWRVSYVKCLYLGEKEQWQSARSLLVSILKRLWRQFKLTTSSGVLFWIH